MQKNSCRFLSSALSVSSVLSLFPMTISMVRVVMDIFINQGASKLFIDFCFVFAEVRSSRVFLYLRACAPPALELIYVYMEYSYSPSGFWILDLDACWNMAAWNA